MKTSFVEFSFTFMFYIMLNQHFISFTCDFETLFFIYFVLSEKTSSDLPVKLIKLAAMPISNNLSQILNQSFSNGIYPELLKIALVVPIHKGDSKMLVNNYRPISLLPLFSKLFEKLVQKRLLNYFLKHDLLFKHQFGFMAGRTTEMAILDLYMKIIDSIDNGEVALTIFLDFAKAFDTVNHNILLKKFYHYGIRGLPLKWFESYLSNS